MGQENIHLISREGHSLAMGHYTPPTARPFQRRAFLSSPPARFYYRETAASVQEVMRNLGNQLHPRNLQDAGKSFLISSAR
jgi:hypothetical protein